VIVIKVDWEREDPKVAEMCELVAKAHSIYVSLTPELRERADLLWDEKIPKKEREM